MIETVDESEIEDIEMEEKSDQNMNDLECKANIVDTNSQYNSSTDGFVRVFVKKQGKDISDQNMSDFGASNLKKEKIVIIKSDFDSITMQPKTEEFVNDYFENFKKNPWEVENLTEFLVYQCPQCEFMCKEACEFYSHAIEYHKEARDVFYKVLNKKWTQPDQFP